MSRPTNDFVVTFRAHGGTDATSATGAGIGGAGIGGATVFPARASAAAAIPVDGVRPLPSWVPSVARRAGLRLIGSGFSRTRNLARAGFAGSLLFLGAVGAAGFGACRDLSDTQAAMSVASARQQQIALVVGCVAEVQAATTASPAESGWADAARQRCGRETARLQALSVARAGSALPSENTADAQQLSRFLALVRNQAAVPTASAPTALAPTALGSGQAELLRVRSLASQITARDEMAQLQLREAADATTLFAQQAALWGGIAALCTVMGAMGLIDRDMYLRKNIETRLAHSEQRFRALIENASDTAVLVAGTTHSNAADGGRVRYASPAASLVWGTGVGTSAWLDGVHPADREIVEQTWAHVLAQPGSVSAPLVYRWRGRSSDAEGGDGVPPPPPVCIESVFANQTDVAGVEGVVVTGRDVSARVLAECEREQLLSNLRETNTRLQERDASLHDAAERLQTAASELERSNRELSLFATVASHDLQEPLRKVRTFSDMVLRRTQADGQLDDTSRDYLQRMKRASERAQSLVEGVLELSRATTRPRKMVRVDLAQTLRDVLGDLEPLTERTHAQITIDPTAQSLPPLAAADPIQMRQLLQNLLSNALKFHTPETAPHVRVNAQVLPAQEGAAQLCLQVQDNGIGFAPEDAERVFQGFARLQGHSRYEGHGIGLALCRRIVERHQGTITAHATPGEGATFVVTLPLA